MRITPSPFETPQMPDGFELLKIETHTGLLWGYRFRDDLGGTVFGLGYRHPSNACDAAHRRDNWRKRTGALRQTPAK